LADEAPTPVLFLAALELTLLLLALCFPGALPEVGFLMVALLAIAHFKRDVWQHLFTELGDKKLKSESDSALDSRRLAHRNLQSLFLELLLLLSVNVAASFVKFSPWIAEACSAALIADAVRALLQTAGTPQADEQKNTPKEPALQADQQPPSDPAPTKTAAPTATAPERQPKKLKNLEVNFWADLEEEDDFQQMLAAKVREEVSAPKGAPAAPKAPAAEAVESLEVPAPADAEDAAGAGGEASRKKKGAKAVRSKRGREGKPQPEDSGNQWATRIRQCGKMKDLQGALAAMEEAAVAAGISSRQHQEVQNALLHSGDAAGDTASDLFNRLKEEKKADVVTFNIMLRSLLSAGKREEEMNEHGLSANKALLIVRDILLEVASVRLCQDWMKNTDFGITNAACSILLKRITSETAADEVDRSFALIDQLSEPVDEDFPAIGKWCRDPSRQVIEAAIRTSRPAVANKFMEMLGSLRNKKSGGSSAATFGSMIKLHGQNRDLQQVWSTWNLMREKGVHQTAADGLSFILNTVIYSSIIKGFAQAKQPEKCFDVLDEMEEQGIPGNTITYNTLLDACAKCGTMSRVPAVFENMRQRQVEPDRITYSTLIKGYCVAGELDCAFKLFDELKADGKLDLDEIVYNSLLDGCGRKQKPQKAMEYLQVKLLGRARRLNDALKLASDYQKDFGLKLNVQVFTCLMQACLLNKTPGWRYDVAMKVPKAMQIYSDMISHRLGRHGTVSWDVYQTGKPTRYWWSRAQKGSWDVEDGCIQAAAFAEATQAGGAGEIPFRWLTLRDSGDGVLKGFRGFLYSFDERRATLQVRGGKVDRKTADLVLEAIRCWTWQILVESCEAKRARVSVTKKASKAFAEAEEGWQKAGSRGKAWLESGYEAWEKQGSRGFHEKPQRRRYKIFSGQRQIPRLGGSQGQSIQELARLRKERSLLLGELGTLRAKFELTLQTLRSILGLELNCSWADIVASQLQSGVDRISSLHPGHKLRERSIRNDPQDGGGQDEWKEEKQEDEEYRSGDSGQELTRQEEDDDEESEAEELRQLLLQAEMDLDEKEQQLEEQCARVRDLSDVLSKQQNAGDSGIQYTDIIPYGLHQNDTQGGSASLVSMGAAMPVTFILLPEQKKWVCAKLGIYEPTCRPKSSVTLELNPVHECLGHDAPASLCHRLTCKMLLSTQPGRDLLTVIRCSHGGALQGSGEQAAGRVAARGTFYSFGHLQSGFCAPQLTVIGLMMSEIACAKREQELGDLQADHERQRAEIEELCDVVASRDDEVGRIRSQLEVYEDQHDLQCMLGTSVTSKAQMKATVLALAMAPSLAAWRASEPFVLLQWATGRYWLRAARLEFCIGHSGETVADCGSGKANLDTLPSNTSTMTLYRPHRERDSQQYGPGTEPCHLFISPTADASEAQGAPEEGE
ncbi:unnamed protein product, partial [Symbiodinium microadriaticum]